MNTAHVSTSVSVQQIQQTLIDIAAKKCGLPVAKVNLDHALSDMGIDSLGLAEFIFDVENHFGVVLELDQLQAIGSLKALASAIFRTIPAPAAQA